MEQPDGGERRRRRQGGGGRALPLQEENKNHHLHTQVPSNDDCVDDDDASSDSDNEAFEQEFEAGNQQHHPRTPASPNNKNNNSITVRQAFVHLLKGYVGPGCLSLPWAMSQLGISMGIAMIFVVCLWSSYNCRVVLLLKRHYQKQQQQQQQNQQPMDGSLGRRHGHNQHLNSSITYPQLAAWLYPYRGHMQRLTTLCICIQQLAVCTVFLSFVGTNLQAVCMAVWDVELSHRVVITLALPAVLALSCLPNLKALAPVTCLATILLMLGFALIGVVIAKVEWYNKNTNNDDHMQLYSQHDDSDTTTNTGPSTYKNWPMAICAILYRYVLLLATTGLLDAAGAAGFCIAGSRRTAGPHLMFLFFYVYCIFVNIYCTVLKAFASSCPSNKP
jgi:Transmembrane amino acid transporter protein